MAELVKTGIEGPIATVTIENPPVNALSAPVMVGLEQAIEALGKNDSVKVVVLTGAGMFFVAGADIRELATLSADKGKEMSARGQAILNKIELMDKPWIAAVNGAALGGGCELMMACHIRIVAERAKIGQPEIDLGIIPGFGGTQRVTRLTNVAKAYELILSGERISAQEAKAIGLVNRVVPDDQLLKEAVGLARKIAGHGLPAIRASMLTIRAGWRHGMDEALACEAEWFGKLCGTYDKNEGLKAFLEKRQPKFEDR